MILVGWTPDHLAAAVEELRACTSVGEAVPRIVARVGFALTKDALNSAFRRHRLERPSDYLRRVSRAATPVPVDDYEEAEPEPDTQRNPRTPVAPLASTEPLTADRTYVDREPEPPPRASSIVERLLVIPDLHAPYHDRQAWRVVLEAGRELRPTRIIVLGDFADAWCVSDHDKSPRRANDLEVELEVVRECRADLDALGASTKHFIEGNHEVRLARYIATRAPALHRMLSIQEELGLAANGWTWTGYRDWLPVGDAFFTHDPDASGMNAHRVARNAFEATAVIGHTHRLSQEYSGNVRGETHAGISLGWLGSFELADYRHRAKKLREWTHAFGVGYVDDRGHVTVHPIPIAGGRAVVEGRLVA
jgi:hypothetical protein